MRASNETEHFLYDYINIENKNILWEWSENISAVKREETRQLKAVLQLETSISCHLCKKALATTESDRIDDQWLYRALVCSVYL